MHFRFGQTPGEIWLDDLHVRDLTAGQDVIPVQDFESGMESFQRAWTFWPPGEQNTVGTIRVDANQGRAKSAALGVTLQNPPDRPRGPTFTSTIMPTWHCEPATATKSDSGAGQNPSGT